MSDGGSDGDSDDEPRGYDALRVEGDTDAAPLVIDVPELPEPSVCDAQLETLSIQQDEPHRTIKYSDQFA